MTLGKDANFPPKTTTSDTAYRYYSHQFYPYTAAHHSYSPTTSAYTTYPPSIATSNYVSSIDTDVDPKEMDQYLDIEQGGRSKATYQVAGGYSAKEESILELNPVSDQQQQQQHHHGGIMKNNLPVPSASTLQSTSNLNNGTPTDIYYDHHLSSYQYIHNWPNYTNT